MSRTVRLAPAARAFAPGIAFALLASLAGCSQAPSPVARSPQSVGVALVPPALPRRMVDFGPVRPEPDVLALATWAFSSDDTGGKAFAVVDKRRARLYVFAADGRLAGTAPVLLGLQPGDETEPGIGSKPIAAIRPDERTTPAGRFATVPGHNSDGAPVVWIDYDAAVSMHAVIAGTRKERRLQRLASADPAQRRISYGCINVPKTFFDDVALPAFARRGGIVYILPDKRALGEVFPGLAGNSTRPALSASGHAGNPAT